MVEVEPGPAAGAKVPDLTDPAFASTRTDEQLMTAIREGKNMMPRSARSSARGVAAMLSTCASCRRPRSKKHRRKTRLHCAAMKLALAALLLLASHAAHANRPRRWRLLHRPRPLHAGKAQARGFYFAQHDVVSFGTNEDSFLNASIGARIDYARRPLFASASRSRTQTSKAIRTARTACWVFCNSKRARRSMKAGRCRCASRSPHGEQRRGATARNRRRREARITARAGDRSGADAVQTRDGVYPRSAQASS